MWKFLCKGSNLHHTRDNTGSLTHCIIRQVLPSYYLNYRTIIPFASYSKEKRKMKNEKKKPLKTNIKISNYFLLFKKKYLHNKSILYNRVNYEQNHCPR